MSSKFMFFANFKETADKLPDELRLKFYDAMTDYVFKGIEPDDAVISALITAIKPSLDKEDGRGGVRDGAGAKKNNQNARKSINNDNEEQSKTIKTIKNNKNNQSFLETETETEEEKNNLTVIQKEKRKFLVPDDWMPKDETKQKLQNQGLDVPKVVAKFINSCQAKGLKYIDHDRAILSWDWSKDASLTAKANDDWGDYWAEMEKKWEAKHEQVN